MLLSKEDGDHVQAFLHTLERLEAKTGSALDTIGERGMSVEEGDIVYRILGACRRMSVALLELTDRITLLDWVRLKEARS